MKTENHITEPYIFTGQIFALDSAVIKNKKNVQLHGGLNIL